MRLLSVFSMLLLSLLFCSGCFARVGAVDKENVVTTPADELTAEERFSKELALQITATLDDRQLAAQVIISGIDGKRHLTQDMKLLLEECPSGGIMLFGYNLDADNEAIQNLLAECATLISSKTTIMFYPSDEEDGAQTIIAIPPFAAVDHEGGSVNRFRPGVADLPSAGYYWEMALNKGRDSAIEQIYADSFNVGRAINSLGVTMNLAPVVEYLNDDNRDFLANRSYGPDMAFVVEAATAFIAGMEQGGILCALKHFPGSAGADPHRFPSVLRDNKTALEELTAPFTVLIQRGYAHAIMVSHSLVPAWDNEIASLSPLIMDTWLRQELGFEGIIICDDFSMNSAGRLKPEAAAVLSLAAGADMVLVWPPDLRRTHRAILAALDDGGLSRERLQEAAGRIIFEKIQKGLVQMRSEK
jgi:beta-N-acetylhexosaminidase